MSPVRFDDALASATVWARGNLHALGGEVYLTRDIYGRIRVLPAGATSVPGTLAEDLHRLLGAFSPGASGIVLKRGLFTPEELAADRDSLGDGVWLVDRLVNEQTWRRAPVANPGHRPRITFFSIKGGVGRSMALVAVAKRLAERGRRVLVVDLDLESPGATSMLLCPDEVPQFGVVDWFVEDAVGQADDTLLSAMVAWSRIDEKAGTQGPGNVMVAPALGHRSVPASPKELLEDPKLSLRDGAFAAKLGRAYASPDGTEFALRLEHMLQGLERIYQPDVVLLDSRAGMHDISAAVVPRLGGTVLLFAGTTSQTWLGYRVLFSMWGRKRDAVAHFRDHLQVVAGQVPELGQDDYLNRLSLSAYELFSEFVYDKPKGTDEAQSDSKKRFYYDLNAANAPHKPLPVYWSRRLVEWEPVARSGPGLTDEQFEAAFGPFLRGVVALPYVEDVEKLPVENPKAAPPTSTDSTDEPDHVP